MRTGKKKITLLLVTLAVLLAVNVAVSFLPFRAANPDVSGSRIYTLSADTRRFLAELDRPVELTYFCTGGQAGADADLRSFLSLYQGKNLTVRIGEAPDESADQTIRLSCNGRTRTLSVADFFYYFSQATYERLSLSEYAMVTSYLSSLASDSDAYNQLLQYYGPTVMTAYFCGDSVLTGAIRALTLDTVQTLYVWTGDGKTAPDWYLSGQLEQYGYATQAVTDLTAVPAGALLWIAPTKDIDEQDAAALSALLDGGTKLFLATSYQATDLPNLAEILAGYGLSTASGMNLVLDQSGTGVSPAFQAIQANHAINERVTGSFIALYAHAIRITEAEGVQAAELLRTSQSGAYQEKDGDGTKSESGSFSFAASAIRGESRVVWLGMQPDVSADSYSGGADTEWTAEALAWLSGYETLTPIGGVSEIPSTLLNVKVSVFSVWIVVFVVLIPLTLIAGAILSRYIRGKKSE